MRHEKCYLGNANLIVQPEKRGTAVAIALSLLRIVERDPSALVAFSSAIIPTPTTKPSSGSSAAR